MGKHDATSILALGAIWGGSYVLMRLGAGEFGALALSGLRAAGAALILLPVLFLTRKAQGLRAHWKPIAVVGIANSALPFVPFNYAALHINAGVSSVFSAAAPLFAGIIAWLWLNERLPPLRWLGLSIGFIGVFGLALNKARTGWAFHSHDEVFAVAACVLASLLYGVAVNMTKKYLAGVEPIAIAAGGQISSPLVLMPFSIWAWPERPPSMTAWASLTALAVVCSALAYVLFFRLIAQLGQTKAIAVTFLIPVFGVGWGYLVLAESVGTDTLLGCVVVLLGTALATVVSPGTAARQRIVEVVTRPIDPS